MGKKCVDFILFEYGLDLFIDSKYEIHHKWEATPYPYTPEHPIPLEIVVLIGCFEASFLHCVLEKC